MASWSEDSSCPSESRTRTKTRGTGLYFTTYALEQLKLRLDNMNSLANWRTLAGDLRIKDLVVQAYEGKNGVNGFSATYTLLRDYEDAEGGIDFHEFEQILRNLGPRGRLDIITDIWNEENKRAGLLLEKRAFPKCSPESPYNSYDPKNFTPVGIPDDGQYPQNNLDGSRSVTPKSDPLTRRPIYDKQNRHSDSSMDEMPQNLKGSTSDDMVVRQEPEKVSSYPRTHDTYQGNRDWCHYKNSRQPNSWEGNSRAYVGAPPYVHVSFSTKKRHSKKKSYLVVSSEQEKDRKLSMKLKKLIQQKGHEVSSVHDLTGNSLMLEKIFKKVDYMIVIYTKHYLREIQMDSKVNAYLYNLVKDEYTKRSGNKRFIPIYDTSKIRELPTELHNANLDEVNYIVGLVNSSPVGDKSPVPHIVREPHSQNPRQKSR